MLSSQGTYMVINVLNAKFNDENKEGLAKHFQRLSKSCISRVETVIQREHPIIQQFRWEDSCDHDHEQRSH